MAKKKASKPKAEEPLEKQLWNAADKLRKNIDAAEYKHELLELYWFLGEQIAEHQESASWGDGFLKRMSKNLLDEFPEMKAFSARNLQRICRWHQFWTGASKIGKQAVTSIAPQVVANLAPNAPQLVAKIPWGHNGLILEKLDDSADVLFYVQKMIENNWSRVVLTHQIESGLHLQEGKEIDNFEATSPQSESDLARQLLRDPCNFDFLTLTKRHNERELEDGLIDHLTKLLLELGAGFAFVGRQYKLNVDGDDYSIDLLFYHLRLTRRLSSSISSWIQFFPSYI